MTNINADIEYVVDNAAVITLPPVNLLDVTLRDGGFMTGFSWSEAFITDFVAEVSAAGITDVEIGYAGGVSSTDGWYEGDATDISPQLIESIKQRIPSVRLYCMINPWRMRESSDYSRLHACGLSGARIAYNASHEDKVWEIARKTVAANLPTTLNVTSVGRIKSQTVIDTIQKAVDQGLTSVSLADTSSVMMPDDVSSLCYLIKERYGRSVNVGFHGHDFLGFGMGNALSAIRAGADTIDASICAVGRGGANLRTELWSISKYIDSAKDIVKIESLFAAVDRISTYLKQKEQSLLPVVCAYANVSPERFELILRDNPAQANEVAIMLANRLREVRSQAK